MWQRPTDKAAEAGLDDDDAGPGRPAEREASRDQWSAWQSALSGQPGARSADGEDVPQDHADAGSYPEPPTPAQRDQAARDETRRDDAPRGETELGETERGETERDEAPERLSAAEAQNESRGHEEEAEEEQEAAPSPWSIPLTLVGDLDLDEEDDWQPAGPDSPGEDVGTETSSLAGETPTGEPPAPERDAGVDRPTAAHAEDKAHTHRDGGSGGSADSGGAGSSDDAGSGGDAGGGSNAAPGSTTAGSDPGAASKMTGTGPPSRTAGMPPPRLFDPAPASFFEPSRAASGSLPGQGPLKNETAGPGARPGGAGSAERAGDAGSAERAGDKQAAGSGADPGGGSGPATAAAGHKRRGGPADYLDEQVVIVPGVARYHRGGCILIRFLGGDDLKTSTAREAEANGCMPCRACEPEKPLSAEV
jgi:hypothetical protein